MRVGNLTVDVGKHEVRIQRTEEDVQKIWDSVEDIKGDVSAVKDLVGKLTIRIALIVGGITTLGWLLMFLSQSGLFKLAR